MLSGVIERFYSGKAPGEVTVREGGTTRVLEPRPDLNGERATVFTWGSDEAGARQFAVALLADALDDDAAAKRYHQDFRQRVIANLPERWTISRTRILRYVRVIKYQRGSAALIQDEQQSIIGLPRVSYKPSPPSSAEVRTETMKE